MKSEYRTNSNNEKLVYYEKIGCWVPEGIIPDEQEIIKHHTKFSHPKISIARVAFNVLLPVIMTIMLVCCLNLLLKDTINWFKPINNLMWLSLGIISCYMLLRTKRIAIFCVLLYQRFAPMHVREKCVFTPTCSDYMILAIKKYGLIKGLKKGKNRIKHCKGIHREDWP